MGFKKDNAKRNTIAISNSSRGSFFSPITLRIIFQERKMCIRDRLYIPYIPYIKLDFVACLRVFRLVFMAHVVLFFLIPGKNADFPLSLIHILQKNKNGRERLLSLGFPPVLFLTAYYKETNFFIRTIGTICRFSRYFFLDIRHSVLCAYSHQFVFLHTILSTTPV